MRTLVLLRHGESVWNSEGLFTGWVDVGLSGKGRKEAESRAVSIRRLGSQEQKVVGLDEALAALAEEAVAPDVRRGRGK